MSRREFDPETEAWVDDLVAAAPPLSEYQERVIAEAFDDLAGDE